MGQIEFHGLIIGNCVSWLYKRHYVSNLTYWDDNNYWLQFKTILFTWEMKGYIICEVHLNGVIGH